MSEMAHEVEQEILSSISRAALVFYVDGRWRPFADDSPESRVTRPDERTTVQFNSFPESEPYAEYRGPHGRWWVHIGADDGLPIGPPTFSPSADTTSSRVS